MKKGLFSYLIIRSLTFPISFLPYPVLHRLGNILGKAAYYLVPKFRKRTLSNLALAKDLSLSEEQIIATAKESFGNLMITCLEYAKLSKEKDISKIATCENPECAAELMKEGKPVIFFCAHQANWEILFLEGTTRMPGVAIGRPIKNISLYEWVLSTRQKFGGKIIAPQNAIREGLRALKKGSFLGIVGDQGMPDSGFRSVFLGRPAWTSPMPAILSHRTGSPIIFAHTRRENHRYYIHYSDPIWPNLEEPMEKEIDRIMKKLLELLEESIKKHPGQWLWQHNRWKQQTLDKVKRPFRQEAICIIFPDERFDFEEIRETLPIFREIYPHEFFTLLVPQRFASFIVFADAEVIAYEKPEELLLKDYRFKLVFDFHEQPEVQEHYLSLSTFEVLNRTRLAKLAERSTKTPLSILLKRALCHAV